jgi:hypothetical protein
VVVCGGPADDPVHGVLEDKTKTHLHHENLYTGKPGGASPQIGRQNRQKINPNANYKSDKKCCPFAEMPDSSEVPHPLSPPRFVPSPSTIP